MLILTSSWTIAKPTVDIAIALDTSGSMQNLIAQVRDGLWTTLNGLGEIKKDGEVADLRLALIEYGSGVIPGEENFMRILSPLTNQHTEIADKLFATQTTGSEEFVGKAISLATNFLDWSKQSSDFRSIIVAGNETVHQGPVKPFESAKDSSTEGIIVNSIFAGPAVIQKFPHQHFGPGFGNPHAPNPVPAQPEKPSKPVEEPNPIFSEWQQLAREGNGNSLNIDISNGMVYIDTPFDTQIVTKTDLLSETYLPFGKNGQEEFQKMIDLNKKIKDSGAGSYISWGSYLGGHYSDTATATWDLVTASELEDFDLSSINDEHLPEKMRGLSLSDKQLVIDYNKAARLEINNDIKDLQEKRKKFIEDYNKKNSNDAQGNFAKALKDIIQKQLKNQGFSL